jgi:hypothetical protein
VTSPLEERLGGVIDTNKRRQEGGRSSRQSLKRQEAKGKVEQSPVMGRTSGESLWSEKRGETEEGMEREPASLSLFGLRSVKEIK